MKFSPVFAASIAFYWSWCFVGPSAFLRRGQKQVGIRGTNTNLYRAVIVQQRVNSALCDVTQGCVSDPPVLGPLLKCQSSKISDGGRFATTFRGIHRQDGGKSYWVSEFCTIWNVQCPFTVNQSRHPGAGAASLLHSREQSRAQLTEGIEGGLLGRSLTEQRVLEEKQAPGCGGSPVLRSCGPPPVCCEAGSKGRWHQQVRSDESLWGEKRRCTAAHTQEHSATCDTPMEGGGRGGGSCRKQRRPFVSVRGQKCLW